MKPNPNYTYLKENIAKQRMLLLQGGMRSGKTFSIIYFIIDLCLNHSGIEIDITRDTFTALKSSAWKDFKDILKQCNLYNENNHNKTDHFYNLNNNIISYYGADTHEKIHGRTRDILWINEAHQFDSEIIDQLLPRTKYRIICDYNPALGFEHWLDPYIEKFPPIITTYKDNPFLTKEQVLDIESRKGNGYWWSVYGTGQRAVMEGVIFTNWEVGEFDTSLPYRYGQDYGFSIDPTTLIKVAVDSKRKLVYVDELLYTTKSMGTLELFEVNKSLIEKPTDLIIADKAERRLITDLGKLGLNIIECDKVPGSVTAGINFLIDHKIIITERSKNVKMELTKYCWSNKRAGIPIDGFNHSIDSIRYAAVPKLTPKVRSGVYG